MRSIPVLLLLIPLILPGELFAQQRKNQPQKIEKKQKKQRQETSRKPPAKKPQRQITGEEFIDLYLRTLEKGDEKLVDDLLDAYPLHAQIVADYLHSNGIEAFNKNDYETARYMLLNAQGLHERLKQPEARLECLTTLAEIYRAAGETQKVIAYYQDALEQAMQLQDINTTLQMAGKLAGIYRDKGKRKIALAFLTDALAYAREVQDRNEEAMILNNIGLLYLDEGDDLEAMRFFRDALELKEELPDKTGLGYILKNVGRVYHNLDNFEEALANHERALKIMQNERDRAGEAMVLMNIGDTWMAKGDEERARDFFTDALRIMEDVGNDTGMARALSLITTINLNLTSYDESIEKYKRALELNTGKGEHRTHLQILSNLGVVLLRSGHISECVDTLKSAYSLAATMKDRRTALKIRMTLARAREHGSNLGTAIKTWQSTLRFARSVGDVQAEITILNAIGQLWHRLGKYKHAQTFFDQALALCRKNELDLAAIHTLTLSGRSWRERGYDDKATEQFFAALKISRLLQAETDPDEDLYGALAELSMEMYEYDHAVDYILQAIDEVRAGQKKVLYAPLYFRLAHAYEGLLDPQKALEAYRDALVAAQEADDLTIQKQATCRLALVLLESGAIAEAESLLTAVPEQAVQAGTPETRALCSRALTALALVRNDLKAAQSSISAAIGQARKSKDLPHLADFMLLDASLRVRNGKNRAAAAIYKKVRALGAKSDNPAIAARSWLAMAELYRLYGNAKKMLSALDRAEAALEKATLPRARVLLYRGEWLLERRQFPLAKDVLRQAKRIIDKTGTPSLQAEAARLLAEAVAAVGEKDDANELIAESLRLFAADSNGVGESYARLSMGRIYSRMHVVDRGRDAFTEARKQFLRIGYMRGVAETDYELAGLYARAKKFDQALSHAQQAGELAVRSHFTELAVKSLLKAGQIHRSRGETSEAQTALSDALKIAGSSGMRMYEKLLRRQLEKLTAMGTIE